MLLPIITLTTDFGEDSPYVAAMKGVILSINTQVHIVDLTHLIPPQDLRHAAHFLSQSVPCFPAGSLHVVVVDPGVGTERGILYVELGKHRLLVPDNGCWTLLAGDSQPLVIRLEERQYWRDQVSSTFHGRDIFAPVAGYLSLGIPADKLGKRVSEWVRLEQSAPRIAADRLEGEVVFIDHFGNLITNIPGSTLEQLGEEIQVAVGHARVERKVRTYGEVPPGKLVALVTSAGTLEIAVNQGNAAGQLGVGVGTPVVVTRRG